MEGEIFKFFVNKGYNVKPLITKKKKEFSYFFTKPENAYLITKNKYQENEYILYDYMIYGDNYFYFKTLNELNKIYNRLN